MSKNSDFIARPIPHEKMVKADVEGGYRIEIFPSNIDIINHILRGFPAVLKSVMPNEILSSISQTGIVGVDEARTDYWIHAYVGVINDCCGFQLDRSDVDDIGSLSFSPLMDGSDELGVYYINEKCLTSLSVAAKSFVDSFLSDSHLIFGTDKYLVFTDDPCTVLKNSCSCNSVESISVQNFIILDGVGDIACNFDYYAENGNFISRTPGAVEGKWELMIGDEVIDANLPLDEALKKLLAAKEEVQV